VFIAYVGKSAPLVATPIEETKREIDEAHGRMPEDTFVEIDKTVYERERKETYPFKFIRPSK